MEYDRALFRVYERIMEDLNASPSPLVTTTSSSSSSAAANAVAAFANPNAGDVSRSGGGDDSGLRRRRRGGEGRQGDQGQDVDVAASDNGSPGGDDGDLGHGRDDDIVDDPESPRSQRSTTTNDDNADDGGNRSERRRRRRRPRQGEHQIMPILARRQFATAMQQQRRHHHLPFVLPIWMARKLDRINHALIGTRMLTMAAMSESNSGLVSNLWSNVRAIVLRRGNAAMQHSSYDSVATSPSQQQQPRAPSTPTSSSLSLSLGGTTNNHRQHFNDDREDVEGGVISLELPPLNTDRDQLTPPRGSTAGEGLRRRSPTRRGQHHPDQSSAPRSPVSDSTLLQPRLSNSSSSSSSSTAASQSSHQSSTYSGEETTFSSSEYNSNNSRRRTNSSGGGRDSSAAPTRTLAQRAIQMQLRQRERFSSQGRRRRSSNRRGRDSDGDSNSSDELDSTSSEDGSDDTSSSDEEGDDDDNRRGNEGCSQHNLYGVMRLSFAVAVFHIFVLISLHVTYVGPYAFRKQNTTTSTISLVSQRWRKLVRGVDDGQNRSFRGLLWGDVEEREPDKGDVVDPKDSGTTLFNCISYALSTRPIEDRSAYFGEDKDKKSSSDGDGDSSGRMLLLRDGDDGGVVSIDKTQPDDDETHYLPDSHDQLPHSGNRTARVGGSSLAALDDDPEDYSTDEYSPLPPRSMRESSTGTTTSSVKPKAEFSPSHDPLLGKDEILQIKIMYGGKCTGRCSRVHNVEYPKISINETDAIASDDWGNNSTGVAEGESGKHQATRSLSPLRLRKEAEKHGHQLVDTEEKNGDDNNNSGSSLKDNELSSSSYWEKVHYRFAIDDALLYLDENSALLHNITIVNVTVTERCLSTGSDDGKLTFLTAMGQFLSQVYGMDSIIINQLMYGIRGVDGVFTSGYVKSMETQERWGWHKEQLEAFEHGSFVEWVLRKLGVMLMSTLAFFLITSVTSLIVRVLTSSGVVLMFPLFTCFRSLGMPGANERILSLSYPWIGSARVAIANRHVHPQSHLVWAHVTKIILYYVMYEACQAAWSVVLYAKSIPEALPVWIYGFAMIWEYFSMVFVRSALSAHFFPRLTFLYFLLYHIYFYSIPYGYFDVALIPLFLFMLHAMLYTILGLEAPNAARGVVNVECPREVYNRLSWHEPVAALPAEWTMFLPLNSRLSPLHDRVSDTPTNDANNNDRWEGDGNAAAG